MTGTGQLPKFEEDLFRIESPEYFLFRRLKCRSPTSIEKRCSNARICRSNMSPTLLVFGAKRALTGKDVRGLIRQHQFNKVEMVKFTEPEHSYDELENMVAKMRKRCCSTSPACPIAWSSFAPATWASLSAKTYDLEVWLPGQAAYREISSCSNCEDFQARRAQIRYRKETKGKPIFVHTLNGSGLAVGRTLVAVLENYQQKDGSVVIPEVLRPYMGGLDRIG